MDPVKAFKLVLDTFKFKDKTAPLNGGEKLYKAWRASGNESYGKQYKKWKLVNPQIDWKKQEPRWDK